MGRSPTTSAGLIDGQYWLAPWIYPPAEFYPIDEIAYVALPAVGDSVDILNFRIPNGNNGIITHIANNLLAGGFNEGSGSVLWQIARDNAAVDGYSAVPASLGSPANPVRHPSGFRVFEGQIITLSVENVSLVVGPTLTGARLMGWYYPKEYENPAIQPM